VWDDCSPRDPTAIALEWRHRFPHFVYHRNPVNLGMPGNLNAVISQATGDFVANLHDADVYAPTLLEKWAAALEQNPEAVLAFCRDSHWNNPRFVRN
jgi:abequosyltransferase